MKTTMLTVAALALAAMSLAAPAVATPADDREFCYVLATQGYPMDCTRAVVMAEGQRNHFATSRSWQDAIRTTYDMTGDEGLASIILSGAISYYCPQYVPLLPQNMQDAYDRSN